MIIGSKIIQSANTIRKFYCYKTADYFLFPFMFQKLTVSVSSNCWQRDFNYEMCHIFSYQYNIYGISRFNAGLFHHIQWWLLLQTLLNAVLLFDCHHPCHASVHRSQFSRGFKLLTLVWNHTEKCLEAWAQQVESAGKPTPQEEMNTRSHGCTWKFTLLTRPKWHNHSAASP